jgi:glucokinase
LFNPDTIIIGGGIALAGDLLLQSLVQEFRKQTMDIIQSGTRIELSSLGIDAGVSGAVALALNRFVFKSHLVNEIVH